VELRGKKEQWSSRYLEKRKECLLKQEQKEKKMARQEGSRQGMKKGKKNGFSARFPKKEFKKKNNVGRMRKIPLPPSARGKKGEKRISHGWGPETKISSGGGERWIPRTVLYDKGKNAPPERKRKTDLALIEKRRR